MRKTLLFCRYWFDRIWLIDWGQVLIIRSRLALACYALVLNLCSIMHGCVIVGFQHFCKPLLSYLSTQMYLYCRKSCHIWYLRSRFVEHFTVIQPLTLCALNFFLTRFTSWKVTSSMYLPMLASLNNWIPWGWKVHPHQGFCSHN